jgi:hypothetical protein
MLILFGSIAALSYNANHVSSGITSFTHWSVRF